MAQCGLSSRSTSRSDVSPSGWVETIGYCCGPDRSRNGGEASASVILLKADGGEVLSRPSGWTYGIECAQRTAVGGPDTSVRVEIRRTKTATCRHIDESGKASPCIPFSRRGRLAAYAGAKGHSFLPDSERERRNTAVKARSVYNAVRSCCQAKSEIIGLAMCLATSGRSLATSLAT